MYKDGHLLQVGDEILSVNGNLFGHLTHDEAVSVLKSSHRLCFLVRYIGKVPHSSLLPKNQRAANSQTHHESQGNLIWSWKGTGWQYWLWSFLGKDTKSEKF